MIHNTTVLSESSMTDMLEQYNSSSFKEVLQNSARKMPVTTV